MTLDQTQTTRDASDIEDLNRGVINQMRIDLAATLGPLPPKAGSSGSAGSSDGSGGMMDDGSGGTGGGSTGGTPSSRLAIPACRADPSQSGTTTGLPNLPFQGGIFGTNDGENATLVIFALRVPSELSMPGELINGAAAQSAGDLRRIIYWKGANGLCRQESRWVTSDGVGNSLEPDRANEATYTIAEEVVGFDVQYADGSGGWLSEWNSDPSQRGLDRSARAVKVTLTLQFPVSKGEPITKTLVQVIPLRNRPRRRDRGARGPGRPDRHAEYWHGFGHGRLRRRRFGRRRRWWRRKGWRQGRRRWQRWR